MKVGAKNVIWIYVKIEKNWCWISVNELKNEIKKTVLCVERAFYEV
jgi:hypothetical protein